MIPDCDPLKNVKKKKYKKLNGSLYRSNKKILVFMQ